MRPRRWLPRRSWWLEHNQCHGLSYLYRRFALESAPSPIFRIVTKSKTAEYVHTGTYHIVDPPAKLVFTWTASNDSQTLVTVEFLDHGEESDLVLTHERFTRGDVAKRYEGGWSTIADKLAAYLAKQKKQTTAERQIGI